MGKGYFLYDRDETTCGGRILGGAPDDTYMGRQRVREGDPVSCGKYKGTFRVCGGMGDTWSVDSAPLQWAGSIESFSSCPCRARFIPSMLTDTYDYNCNRGLAAQREKSTEKKQQAALLPAYLTGEKAPSGFVPDYPVLRNTHDFPDEALRALLRQNNQDVMLLTLPEAFEVLSSWGMWKSGWVSITETEAGQFVVNYGVNIKDVVTTSMVISQLGSFGIKATTYVNHKGTELIKISGYPGIRKILNAPVFAAKNPKIVDLGIGKYGLKNAIISGARLTFYVAAAYRTVDYILNDETSLAKFLGSLATDAIKIGIVASISWGIGIGMAAITGIVAINLGAVVIVSFGAALALQSLDEKFGITDKLVIYLEHSQQEFVEKSREIESGLLDLGAMFTDKMLDKGREVLVSEIRKYIRERIQDITPGVL
jgi:hypothetical protein